MPSQTISFGGFFYKDLFVLRKHHIKINPRLLFLHSAGPYLAEQREIHFFLRICFVLLKQRLLHSSCWPDTM